MLFLKGFKRIVSINSDNSVRVRYVPRGAFPENVVCFCHSAMSNLERNTVPCHISVSGCGGVIHCDCVQDLIEPTSSTNPPTRYICPLCVVYLNGSKNISRYTEGYKYDVILLY
jgi:hypothetical protein